MADLLKKIDYVLDKTQKRELTVLFFMILVNSGFELLGVSAVLPLMTAVTEPQKAESNTFLVFIKDLLHIPDIRMLVAVLSLAMVLVYIIKNCFILWMTKTLYHFTYNNQKKLAIRLMDCYMHQSYSFHTMHNVAEIERNINVDVNGFFTAIQYTMQLATEVLVCMVLGIFLAFMDIKTTVLISLIMAVLLFLFVKVFKGRLKKLGETNRVLTVQRNKWLLQSLNGIKEIKTSDREAFFLNKYESVYHKNAEVFERMNFLSNMPKPVVEMVSISAILLFMALRIIQGENLEQFITVLSVFAVAAFRMLPSFNRISSNLSSIMFNKPSIYAVYKDLKEVEDIHTAGEKTEAASGGITLKKELKISDVHFSYPSRQDTEVLKGVTLSVPYKKAAALVGASGSGKTTMVDIILGLYRPSSGSIEADGTDIYTDLKSWHSKIGYIPQNIFLIDDTIRANIAFGVDEKDIDDEKVWEALEEAQLADFVRQQPDGLDSNVGDRGVKISGGQRQRIGIARALYNRPELLILDEATSALDNETEKAVMDAIYRLSGRMTMIVIAHRISTIQKCDLIYRIENGSARQISYSEASGEEGIGEK